MAITFHAWQYSQGSNWQFAIGEAFWQFTNAKIRHFMNFQSY